MRRISSRFSGLRDAPGLKARDTATRETLARAATISAVGHLPVAGLALILGIDRFMSEARALTNLVGNGVATIVVAKWVKELDSQQLDDVLNNRTPVNKSHELSS